MKKEVTEKFCTRCNLTKPIDDFYSSKNKYRTGWCKSCISIYDKEKYQKYKDENCGGIKISKFPNTYINDSQKECTFYLMESMGFTFNEEKEIWWKPGFRTEDGIFIKVKPKPKRKRQYLTRLMIKEIYELFDKNVSVSDIALKYGTHENTIYKYRLKYEASRNRRNRNTT
jgi:hypothetical protein